MFYTGDDRQLLLSPYYYYYGNLVILEHHPDGLDQPLYSLYAHLSEIEVAEGERVQAGQEIGKVGMSGARLPAATCISRCAWVKTATPPPATRSCG